MDENMNINEEEKSGESSSAPNLPLDFYMKILFIPPCKRGQPCNGCGQCSR